MPAWAPLAPRMGAQPPTCPPTEEEGTRLHLPSAPSRQVRPSRAAAASAETPIVRVGCRGQRGVGPPRVCPPEGPPQETDISHYGEDRSILQLLGKLSETRPPILTGSGMISPAAEVLPNTLSLETALKKRAPQLCGEPRGPAALGPSSTKGQP